MLFQMKWITSFLIVALSTSSFGQMTDYSFKRELTGVKDQWHKIVLPNEIFGKTNQALTDIRIFGLTSENDTIEAPYLLRLTKEKKTTREITFNILNTSHNDRGYYYTFEVSGEEPVNQLKLDFEQTNFEWKVTLEGSQDQREWYTVVEDYRILSIKNDFVNFQFTNLTFPSTKYRYIRLLVESKEKPDLSNVGISQEDTKEGTYREYEVKKRVTQENEQTRQTEVSVELEQPVPVSHLRVIVSDTLDYYRPATIRYLVDSFDTEQGWKYNYKTLTSGTLNSLGENVFDLGNVTAQKLKIIISNRDNQPLKVAKVEVKGYLHELQVRFARDADYFLVYGNEGAARPSYDIGHFTDNIPENITLLTLGNEQEIEQEDKPFIKPLFQNKAWLWAVMVVIILLLGVFSLKMMRKG